MTQRIHEQNRRSWNQATRVHNSHKDDQAGFLRGGGSTLFPEELELLGEIEGRTLLHLQCNAGQDTLSLAQRGAQVTGVDISDEAIEFAQACSRDAGIPARFERSDLYDWFAQAVPGARRFDRVFSSYGAIPWLSDLRSWAAGIAGVLEDGGRFVLVEFHPVGMMFDELWAVRYPYAAGNEPLRVEEGVGDYVEDSPQLAPSGYVAREKKFTNEEACFEYFWSPIQVAAALVDAGLHLERLVEYPYCNGVQLWERMRALPGRRFLPPEELPQIPLMYGVSAVRNAS